MGKSGNGVEDVVVPGQQSSPNLEELEETGMAFVLRGTHIPLIQVVALALAPAPQLTQHPSMAQIINILEQAFVVTRLRPQQKPEPQRL